MLRAIVEDARELARVSKEGEGARAALRAALRNDSFAILLLTRVREAARRRHVPLVNHLLRRVQTVVFGIEIGKETTIGRGVWFVHPISIVIGGDAKVGDRVRFMGSNTVGTAREDGYPEIAEDVVLGCGARVLGPVRVGRGAVIGANAVVLEDVPAGAVAVGIPARALPRTGAARPAVGGWR